MGGRIEGWKKCGRVVGGRVVVGAVGRSVVVLLVEGLWCCGWEGCGAVVGRVVVLWVEEGLWCCWWKVLPYVAVGSSIMALWVDRQYCGAVGWKGCAAVGRSIMFL